jgi:ATP-binding cassette subfamily B protein
MKAHDLVIPYFKSHWRTLVTGLLALMTVDLAQLMIPRVTKWVVDDLTLLQATPGRLARYGAAIAGLALVIGLFRFVWRHCLLGTARYLEMALRNRLLGHLQTLSADYFDQVKTGDLMAHATNDITQVRMAAGMGLVAFNDAVAMGAAAIGFMLYIHVELTLYVLIPMPLIVIGTRLLGRRMHRRYQKVQAAFSDLTEAVRERCAGMRMIKAHAEETAATAAIETASQAYVSENMKLVGVTSVFFPLMMLFTNVSLAIVLYFGGRKTILAEITPGDFVAFISYLNLLSWPMMALGWVTNLVQRGGASLERLKEILQRQPTIRQPSAPRVMSRLRGDVAFEQVSFAYPSQSDRNVLKEIELAIAPGQIVGVVGPPASGKSTLLSLIPRLYDVGSGRVVLDGVDVRDLDLSDLRRQVVCVPQEPFIFAGTIRENILFGCDACTRAQLDRVIEDTCLTETLAGLPDGLDTVVGEKGILLSGGQKQRIALARGLLIDAGLLLLDDPISQVDTETGARIVAAIHRLAGYRTVVVVSHRLAAVRSADRIVSLEAGRLIEAGTHDQLLARKGYYARVYALQELEYAR